MNVVNYLALILLLYEVLNTKISIEMNKAITYVFELNLDLFF